MQYENWTFEQKQKLHDLYDKRVIMKTREADLANIRLDKDKELHPENYPGLFKLIAYGPPDYDGMSTRDYVKQMQEFYNYYKSIDNCVIDNDYLHWINSEKIRLNNL